MTCLEHYFENLICHGKDIKGEPNKNMLSEEQREAVEICYSYVLWNMFGNREELDSFLSREVIENESSN